MFDQEIEISLNDNGYYGYGETYYLRDVIGVNVSNVNDELNIISTISMTEFTVRNGFSVPLYGLQVSDIDLNKTNTELLSVNITCDDNKIGLYALNGLHFLNIDDNNGFFKRTSKYSSLDLLELYIALIKHCYIYIIMLQMNHIVEWILLK